MKWNIITDSSCDLIKNDDQEGHIQISIVPFIISVGEYDYIDDEKLNTLSLLNAIEEYPTASHTSCPSPQKWLKEFERAEQSIAITISSALSGSMNSAMIAREIALEQDPQKKIAVIDSCSAGPELIMCIEKIRELIDANYSFDDVVLGADKYLRKTHTMFALSSFDNLVKNGRLSKLKGFIAKRLGFWGVGIGSDEGTIHIRSITRGERKTIECLLENMKERNFQGDRVFISHCHNLSFVEKLRDRISEIWHDTEVRIYQTRGLCSYYAERGGLIVAY